MPRKIPAISRPPDITSSIAYSSATRMGFSSGTRLPTMASLIFLVRWISAEPIRLGFDINPNGEKWCSLQPTASNPQSSAYAIVSI